MARLTHAESQARTRDRLIAAAARVFARRGFHGASVDEIADEAELTKGAVYSNFASKDELFLGVVETCLQPPAELYRQLEAQANEQTEGDVASPPPRLGDLEEIWCLLQIEFWLYALRIRRCAIEWRLCTGSSAHSSRPSPGRMPPRT